MTLTSARDADAEVSPASSAGFAASVARQEWERTYATLLVVLDCLCIYAALVAALLLRFGGNADLVGRGYETSYAWVAFVAGPVWLLLLALHRCYDARLLDAGPGEYRRVFAACFRLAGITAIICYSLKINLARGFIGIALPVGTALLLVGRYGARKWLHTQRARGAYGHRVLVVGTRGRLEELIARTRREPHVGLFVVGACLATDAPGLPPDVAGVPVVGTPTTVLAAARAVGADTIAVTASPGMTSPALRRLSWELEGTGLDLCVAPILTDVTGPRIHIRPVAGMPLLLVEEPKFEGPRKFFKTAQDTSLALLMTVVLSPLLLVVWVAVRVSGHGPAIFRQTRVGLGEREFTVFKFRTMRVGAEVLRPELGSRNEAGGPLFKMRDDPRVTGIGRWLRRHSLDELPQLFNVLRGDMALVGPRPPLPDEVSRYEHDVRRRLLVKPGMTGLWQVEGRSDLPWEDGVRLDLNYVENWSLALDLQILWKTLFVVLRRRGAY